MANVYRKATKSVHRSILEGGARFDVLECNLDPGGRWGPVVLPGPRCSLCFGRPPVRGTRRKVGATAIGASGSVLVAAALIALQASPVSSPTPSYLASFAAVGSVPPAASVTPGPSEAPPGPSATPALTPEPSRNVIYIPTQRPIETDAPTKPPTPEPTCFHPGLNHGVDECRWPHN